MGPSLGVTCNIIVTKLGMIGNTYYPCLLLSSKMDNDELNEQGLLQNNLKS
jgi:hypothetical protein